MRTFAVCSLLLALTPAAAGQPAGDLPRQFICGIWWEPYEPFTEHVKAALDRDFTGVRLTVPWHRIEPEQGQFRFEELDRYVDFVKEQGASLVLDIDVGRGRPLWSNKEAWAAARPDGSLYLAQKGDSMYAPHPARSENPYVPALADDDCRAAIVTALRRMVAHVESRHPGYVLFYYPIFSRTLETEYFSPEVEGGGHAWLDYSHSAQDAFRQWLTLRHGGIKTINNLWGTDFASIESITMQDAPRYDHQTFRNEMLGRFIDDYGKALHEIPNVNVAAQFGCIWDGLAIMRATVDAERLIRNVDILFVDDGPPAIFNNRFSMDRTRGAAGPDRIFGNEIDGPWHPNRSDEGWREQGIISYDRGVRYMFAANWGTNHLRDRKTWTLFEKVAAHMEKAPPRPEPRKAMLLSLAQAYSEEDAGFYKCWDQIGPTWQQLGGEETPVDIIADRVLLERPGQAARYTEGIYLPASQEQIADATWKALTELKVPVYAESAKAGSLNEYGKPRETAGVFEGFPE